MRTSGRLAVENRPRRQRIERPKAIAPHSAALPATRVRPWRSIQREEAAPIASGRTTRSGNVQRRLSFAQPRAEQHEDASQVTTPETQAIHARQLGEAAGARARTRTSSALRRNAIEANQATTGRIGSACRASAKGDRQRHDQSEVAGPRPFAERAAIEKVSTRRVARSDHARLARKWCWPPQFTRKPPTLTNGRPRTSPNITTGRCRLPGADPGRLFQSSRQGNLADRRSRWSKRPRPRSQERAPKQAAGDRNAIP